MTHELGVREITDVRIGLSGGNPQSLAAKAIRAAGIVGFYNSSEYIMELIPELPLILRW